MRIGVIADGTTRGGPGGVAEGARRVVEHAEWCAQRGKVGMLAVFILSPSNLRRRKRAFFAALHAELLRLLSGVSSGRVLRGIRVELHGRLDRLLRKGGIAARLGHVIELLIEATRPVESPALSLVLCVDYAEDSAAVLDLDVLIRTGMEEPSVLRLSGLGAPRETACFATTTLYRDLTIAELDRALSLAGRRPREAGAGGFSADFVAELLAALGRADFPSPLRLTLPLAAPASEATAMLQRWAESGRARGGAVSVTADPGESGRPCRYGPRRADVEVRLIAPGSRPWTRRDEPLAWLVPGQTPPLFRVCGAGAGDANIHACEATPEGVIRAIRQALDVHAAHPLLHGAPRPVFTPVKKGVPGTDFAAACLSEARSIGLVSGEVDWERQALGYALTAFCIGLGRTPEPAASQEQETGARTLARIMLALASSDEEISDRVFPGERPSERRARLAASTEALIASVRGAPGPLPSVRGKGTLEAIARVWQGFFEQRAGAADEALLTAARRSAEDLYRATLREISRADPLFASLARGRFRGPVRAETLGLGASVPEVVVERILDLVRRAESPGPHGEDARRELRLLCRLCRVAPSIGAGCALLAMAATVPAHAVPAGGAAALLRATPLVDCYFRLANDLAFDDVARGDRDRKPTTFTCLIPKGLSDKARERAAESALSTCRAAAEWLDREMRGAVADLERRWPLAAGWLRRGTTFGRRAYETGHYDRLPPTAVAAIVAEACCQ